MKSRISMAGAVLAAAIGGTALVAQVQAGPDMVAFPETYAQGVKWLVIDKPDRKEVHEHYATPAALAAARNDQPMPSGTVFTLVRYAARLDAQGSPLKAAHGILLKGDIVGFGVMEKRTGWGTEYPDTLRNGEWEYRAFTADKTTHPTLKLTACFGCHKPQADRDFVQAYDKLKAAAR